MPRMTKTEKLAKMAADQIKIAEHRARQDRRTRAYRLFEGRGFSQEALYKLVANAEANTVELPSDEEITRELTRLSSTLRLHEGDCHRHFIETGRATYRDSAASNYCIGLDKCEMCAQPLLCNGEPKAHTFRGLSQAECRERGIYHGGACYHVSICVDCNHVSAVDSSD